MAEAINVPATKPGWKTKAAAILAGVYALVGMALYFIAGPDAQGALSVSEGVPLFLAGFGLLGLADKLKKLTDVMK